MKLSCITTEKIRNMNARIVVVIEMGT
jgi:hypothetical protein